MSQSYLVRPDEIERFVFVPKEMLTPQQAIRYMQEACEGAHEFLDYVQDAEGEVVCVAPRPIARWIATLINAHTGDIIVRDV